MALCAGARKTEHAGAKHARGGWGKKVEVKKASRKFRRRNAKTEIAKQLSTSDEAVE